MLTGSIIFFALAAVGGLVLASIHKRGDTPPVALALGHGLLAATGLVLLLIVALTSESLGVTRATSLIAFAVAAVGGFYLFSRRFTGGSPSFKLIAVHAGVAVIAFVLLLVGVFG